MTFQRSSFSSRAIGKQWKRRQDKKSRGTERRLDLETLEPRQVMAAGPQLAGIQANDETLLRDGQVRKTAPQELTFHFNDGANLDSATVLDAIRITRAGGDNAFASAVATTDFNTNGGAVMDFTAATPGESGNGIALQFIKNDLGAGIAPKITVLGDTISVELNSTVGSQTTAGQLRDALNANTSARKLVVASLRTSSATNVNIATPAITYSPVVTAGANAASVVTSLNAGSLLQLKLTALQAGPTGNGIEVVVNRVNMGGVSPPQVSVVDRVITVDVNSNSVSPSTAAEFAAAINNHPEAGQLVRVTIPSGRPETAIGNRVNPGTRLRLAGTQDIPVVPGYVGLGATPREIVMRFKEALPDDLYHVEVLGTGPFALRNSLGLAFGDQTEDGVDNGIDYNLGFELNLGAQILSVVPQPITRNSVTNTLQQARNQILVYFNNDDLWPTPVLTGELATNPTVVDPAFYQLIFTRDTATNTDDVVYRPKVIQYDPTTDLAVLQFDKDLDQLGSGAGTFRLRVGTDESAPLTPVRTALTGGAQVATDFGSRGAATVLFQQVGTSTTPVTIAISKRDLGAGAAPVVTVAGSQIQLELNSRPGSESSVAQVVAAINGSATANRLVVASLFNTASPATDVTTPLAGPTTLTLREVGSSFETALNLSVLGEQNQIIASALTPQAYELSFPGSIDEPGHRDLPLEVQQHFLSLDAADAVAGITTAFYNFQDEYGFDPLGNVLRNSITENQKQRAREVFSLYSQYLGIQFVESDNLGMTIVTGDLRALDPDAVTGIGGILGIAGGGLTGTAVMDVQDFSGIGADIFGGSWFYTAMHEIGHLLGLGHTDELPPQTILDSTSALAFPENTVEPQFPGNADILHGQYLFRPDGKDIDLYRFEVRDSGRLTLETFAERLPQTSLLDTVVSLYRQNSSGQRELVARNDDYFSNDSFLELDVSPGVYWVGVSASGNSQYDPAIEDSGLGGRSEGNYELRFDLRPNADRSLVDSTAVEVDGDGDGVPGGVFNYWFRAQTVAHTIIVDKLAGANGTGAIGQPFNNLQSALAATQPGDVVRVVGNAGTDRNPATLEDNRAYELGFNELGQVMADGPSLEVPQGVTVMVDAGAIFKSRRARLGVGSSSETLDQSASALQVLGVPVQLNAFGEVVRDLDGNTVPGSVYFTSLHDADIGLGTSATTNNPDPARGDWGGLDYRRDIDARNANRFDYEDAGVFLDFVSHADIRYGGGSVIVNGVQQTVSPINLVNARPTILFNLITESADAAISATPDSFEETNFHSPIDQRTPFTSDYVRVGPEIHGNTTVDNSINGLFIRVNTPGGGSLQPQTVAGRWNDTDIVHVLNERLVVQGTAGGHLVTSQSPSVQLVTATPSGGGELLTGTYHYRVVFVDDAGNESAPSNVTSSVTIDDTTAVRSIQLANLPFVPTGFVSKRVYRSDRNGDAARPYSLVAELNATATAATDQGINLGTRTATFGAATLGLRPRLDARLSLDPGIVVKLNGGSIETTIGADFYAEGIGGGEIVFTSGNDDRYGIGGTFDTTDNEGRTAASPGDWGGIRIGAGTRGSLDHTVVAYGGGTVGIEGGFSSFNAIEISQSEARVTHSWLEQNASGSAGASDREGRGFNRAAVIFVRASQPVIADNTILFNQGPAVSIDASALNADNVVDSGKSVYVRAVKADPIDLVETGADNQGPLVRLNQLQGNAINGMQVRGGTLTTESVWDDTDIVHVLRNETVYVPDFHTFGGLRLESSATESLVVKLEGATSGITATGRPLDIDDRIGGSAYLVGQPGRPVVLTSLHDDSVGAGFQPDGQQQVDTESDGESSDDPGSTPGGGTAVSVVSKVTNANALRDALLGPGVVPVGNATLIGGADSSGLFANGADSIGIADGIVLSTGDINAAAGPNTSDRSSGSASLQGDAQLDAEFGVVTLDTTYLQFDFVSQGGSLFFNYVFASEEYNEYVNDTFNDAFAFFLDGQNIALLPGTTTPVAVNNVNGGNPLGTAATNPQYYVNNDINDNGQFLAEVGYDGFTTVLTAQVLGLAPGVHNIKLAVSDVDDFVWDSAVFLQAGSFSDQPVGSRAVAGDWRGVTLDEYSNDRNVSLVVESESGSATGIGNGTPSLAQELGSLAPREKSGDENLRLGFEVHGNLNQRGDADVYSFQGVAGTEVWFDIDATETSVDTIIELVDANGQVLARSNDSGAEAANPALLYKSPSLPAGTVNPLRKAGYDPKNPLRDSALEIQDHFTTNPRDAGMRLVLPGTPGATSTYHVRVRSNSADLSNLAGGLTKGNYRLQLRLRELDEKPGSTVRYSDIRYAANGISIFGQPQHSPLLGEAREVEALSVSPTNNNNTQANAQVIGNVLRTDRGALSLQGLLDLPGDVDFYEMRVEYDSIQGAGPSPHASLVFDLDYADGLARPNTTLWVFDSEGRLILRGTGSNVAEDRPSSSTTSTTADLSRGSVGTLDPYIGPVQMPAGPDSTDLNPAAPNRGVYYLAVTANTMSAAALQQYLQAAVPANVESVRLEPVNSLRRIAEDRIGFSGGSAVAEPPVVPVLIDTTNSIVPFHLGDVTLFVGQDIGLAGNTVSTLRLVDPFTGATEATAGSFVQPIADIAMRGDGNLFAFSLGPNSGAGPIQDSTTGTYVQIDTATAATTVFSDDGVDTYVQDPMNVQPAAVRPNNNNGYGMSYNAVTFPRTTDTQFSGYAVGTRNDSFDNSPSDVAFSQVDYMENILYNFDINSGVVRNPGGGQDKSGVALLTGAGTQKRELGEILTYTRITPNFAQLGDVFSITINGRSIEYTAGGTFGFATPEEVVAGLAAAWATAALTIPEFAAYEVLNSTSAFAFETELRVRLTDAAAANYDIQASVTSASGFSSITVDGYGPGGVITGIASLDGFSFFAVTDRGGLYQVNTFPSFSSVTSGGFFFTFSNNLATYVRNSAADLLTGADGQPIAFAGLTRGPQNVEGGKYADMLFGITADGEMYAFNTAGELQPIFVNNATSVETGLFAVNGLAFSTLDRNLWQTTGNRGTEPGHGLVLANNANTEPFDGSRLDAQLGGTSLYFGNDRSTNRGGNQSFSNTAFIRDYNFPGGAYGSVISNPFSLSGYSASDLPVLYFNYFLETENTDYNPNTNPVTLTRDSLRVFVSGDDGNWTLLGTNNEFQDAVRSDEFDIGAGDTLCTHPAQATEPCVQKLFDTAAGWRQVRVPLNAFAGQANLRLRFDFSTAGEMQVGDTFTVGSELRALEGNKLRDGQTFTLDGANTLEFDLGTTLVAPNGAGIQDGNSFTIALAGQAPVTFEFDSDGSFSRNIAAVAGNLLRDGDQFQVRVGNTVKTFEFDSGVSLQVPAVGGGTGGLRDGDRFTIDGVDFEFDTNGSFTPGNAIINLVVDSGLQLPAVGGGVGGLRDGDRVVINSGLGGPDVVFEFDAERPATVGIGNRVIDLTNLELQVPVAGSGFGGINDGDSFTVSDGFGGPDVVFEFDKNNSVVLGNRVIPIPDGGSQDEVATAIVTALQISGLGLRPVNQGGGLVRLGVFRHSVDTSATPRLGSQIIAATQDEVAERLADSILNSGLGLTPTYVGTGLIRLGSTTAQVNAAGAPTVQFRSIAGNQNEVANLIVQAIQNTGLPAAPVNLGSGQVFLGRQVAVVDTTLSPTLSKLGAAGVGAAGSTAVVFHPQDTAATVASSISTAINGAGLGIATTVAGNAVTLPSNVSFSPNGTPLAPSGVRAVTYSKEDSPLIVANNMVAAIQAAYASAVINGSLATEGNDTLATAISANLPGGAATYQASGVIGDNTSFGLQRGLDVDFLRLDLVAGQHVTIQATTPTTSLLDAALRLFDSSGNELAAATSTFDPLTFLATGAAIDFHAVTTGTYYVAVSSSANLTYDPRFEGSADLSIVVPASGGAIGGLTDGESFSITPPIGNPVVFEFDSNDLVSTGSIRIRLNDVLLQVPAAAAGAGGIQDGDTFVINDNRGSGDVRFEFDTDGIVNAANRQVFIGFFGASPSVIAQQIASAIQVANLGLTPSALGNGAVVVGASTHTVDASGTPSLVASALPRSQRQIATSIRDAIRGSQLGILPTLDALTNTVSLDIRDQRVDATLSPNLTLASPSNTGGYGLTVDVENAFELYQDGHRINVPAATSATRSGLQAAFLEGQAGASLATRTPVKIHSGMTSTEVAAAIADGIGRSTAGYVRQIVAAPGESIQDGEVFAIGDGTTTVTFEFQSGFSLQLPDLAVDPNAYLDGESFDISSGSLVSTFEFDNDGSFSAGNSPIRFNDILVTVPAAGFFGLQDGDSFSIDQGLGTPPDVFEFDLDGVIQAGRQGIAVAANATQNDVANAVVRALRTADIGLNPINRGSGQVQLGVVGQTIDVTGAPGMSRRTILLTQDEIAEKVAAAIATKGLGFTPVNLGGGRIHLGGTANQTIDVTNALTVQVIGSPGVRDPNAIVIPIFPSASTSAGNVSELIRAAIDTAVARRGLRVTETADGARRINLQANELLIELSNAPSLSLNNAGDSVKTYDNIVKVIGHTVSNRGPLGLETSLAGDVFGAFNTSGPQSSTQYPGALRGMANTFEGVYIDDIVIGFAERGEMITGAAVDTTFVTNDELLNTELPVGFIPHREIEVGPYQLEVRRAAAYGQTYQDPIPEILLTDSIDTNDRLSQQTTIVASPGNLIADGQLMTISDGYTTVNFEFVDSDLPNNSAATGHIPISYRASDSAAVVARRIRDAINLQATINLKLTAILSDGQATGSNSTSERVNVFGNASVSVTESNVPRTLNVAEPSDTLVQAIATGIGTDGVTRFTGNGSIGDNPGLLVTSSDVDLFSMLLEAGQTVSIAATATATATTGLDSLLWVFDQNGQRLAFNDDTFTGVTFSLNPFIEFTAPTRGTYFVGISGYNNYFYSPQFAGSGTSSFGNFSTGPYQIVIETVVNGLRSETYDTFGDQNIVRDQGQIVIEGNRISNSRDFAILIDAGDRNNGVDGNAPHQGPTRVTRELNEANLVPGVVVANNLITRSGTGGIRFSGETVGTGLQTGAMPFGRIVNNTIVGGEVGIQVDEFASPTLLNNILASQTTGISVDSTSTTTVVGGTVFQNVATRTVGTSDGSFPIILSATDSLFLNAAADNYYLAPGALAIDSSVNSVQDRSALVAVRSPLDISASPILAPSRDAIGQLRVDDPGVNTPPGMGGNVFKDRGALDRADFNGPTAVMVVPGDNDPQGRDKDARSSYIELTAQVLSSFSIQLQDGLAPTDAREGTGADDSTVRADRVTLYRDGVKLTQGLDYKFSYDTTNNVIRLTPLAGIWEQDRQYDIVLSNSRGVAISAPAGNVVQDGDLFQITDKTGKQVEFEFDSGYTLQVPQTLAIQVPSNGGLGITDGETFTITDGTRTVRFEFDTNAATQNDTVPPPTQLATIITYAATDTQNDIANKMVTAIRNTSLGLLPVNVVNSRGRGVHLGSRPIHVVDLANSPSLILTGTAAGIEDGQTFTIDDGSKVVTFEFVEGIGSAGTNRAINFTLNQTNDQIADAIVAAIKAAAVGLTPTHHEYSDGQIHLGGTLKHVVANVDSLLTIAGSPGVRPAWSLKIPTLGGKLDFTKILDGEQFIIRNGNVAATFELDSDGRTTPGNRAIAFTNNSTTLQLANAVAIAIRNANLGLSPTSNADGFVTLTGTTAHSVVLTASSFQELGRPGVVAAEQVSFIPGDYFTPQVPARKPIFSKEQMATVIATAINNARLKNLFDKTVVATATDEEVQVEAVTTITGVTSIFRSNITDIAGNALKSSRPTGTTTFTVFIGSGLDYGDAPSAYPVLAANEGARHQIVGDYYLGTGIDTDFDGQPSAQATGDDLNGTDDEDGVVVTQPFTGSYGGAITVTASGAGYLDAWVDFNQDGDWNDAGEQIFASRALVPGANPLNVNVAGTAKPGLSAARFRFSSRGGLTPTGLAEDGEVEDYMLAVNANPWRNPKDGLDVDNNDYVVPQDALIVVNALNSGKGGRLPNPPVGTFKSPPYLDANGDGFLTPQDALVIINFLNTRAASGEGGDESAFAALTTGSSAEDALLAATMFTTVVDHRVAIDDEATSDDSEAEIALYDVLDTPTEDEEQIMTMLASSSAAANSAIPSLSWLLASSAVGEGEGSDSDAWWNLLADDVEQATRRDA